MILILTGSKLGSSHKSKTAENKMKIATTIGELYNYFQTPAEAIKCYAGTGFKYLDYCFYSVHRRPNSPYMEDDDRFWKEEIAASAETAAEYGFRFVQAHAPGYNPLKPWEHEKSMRAIHRTIEACGMLQIPNTVIHTSYSKEHLYPADKKAYFEYNRQFLMPLLETAEKHGVTICFENSTARNMGSCYFPRTVEDMNDFAAFMDHSLLKCCWDTGHALMEEHTDQYDDLMVLKENLRTVHIHDNSGLSDAHLAPYCGKLDLGRVIQALKDMDFKGFFTFEANNFMRNSPLEIKLASLSLLYKIGKTALESYGVFEE